MPLLSDPEDYRTRSQSTEIETKPARTKGGMGYCRAEYRGLVSCGQESPSRRSGLESRTDKWQVAFHHTKSEAVRLWNRASVFAARDGSRSIRSSPNHP